jgi:hypothetical protein
MHVGFQQPDTSHAGNKAPVWTDSSSSVPSVLFRHALQVNTDGTQRSYSVDDFWGETKAINNLCNAMSDSCGGLSQDGLKNRRIITQDAKASGWPADKLKATRIDSGIIPFKNGKPCPEVGGFLVSATALHANPIEDVCDINQYLDAATVPALVLPQGIKQASGHRAPTGFDLANAKLGDLIVAISPSSTAPVYGVVGDAGPATKLGEGSVALNGQLKNINVPPKNYKDVTTHWVVGDATVLIFPGTRDIKSPYLTADRINRDAAAKFAQWGGGDVDQAMTRLKTCSTAAGK